MNAVVTVFNLQNEIVHRDGVVGRLGNAAQVERRRVLPNTAALLRSARRSGVPVIHVGSGFDEGYPGLNRSVPQFAELETRGRMRLGSWDSDFHDQVAPEPGDVVLHRGGLGAFAATPIGEFLPAPEGTRVYVAGVSTRLVVEAAVFEFTDRGYAVSVVEDCCAAATDAAHAEALTVLARFAEIESADRAAASFGRTGRTPPYPDPDTEQSHG